MKNDSFIQHLDYIYGLVEEEYQKCRAGNGKYAEKHLECILKELRIMRFKNDGQFSPYYPRGITDTWDHDDELGNELLKLAREYLRLKRTGQ